MMQLEGRRSSIQIIYEILRLLRLGEAGKTEVMYTAKLSYYQTQKYLAWLSELKSLEIVVIDGHPVNYRITDKGLTQLTKIEMIQETLRIKEIPELLIAPEVETKGKHHSNILRRLTDAFQRR
jgi:predicted transcriptional regulator